MASFLDFKITDAGKQMAFNAASTGINVDITHIAFGDSYKDPTGTEVSLGRERKRVKVAGGSRITLDQVRLWGLWSSDTESSDIREVGVYAGTTLFAYYSKADGGLIGKKTAGGDFVFYYDWKLSEIPTEVISVIIDPSAATAIAVLAVHEKDLMAHDHFMRRAAMAQEGEGFKWGGLAAGTSSVIEISLPFESLLTSYAAGQVFRFIASQGNSGPTAMRVNSLELRSVRKYGNTALVSGDLVKGSVYEVTYDGSNFQLNSGVGGSAETVTPEGDVFFVHSFTATAGQTSFEVVYNVGALMVFRGGDIVQPEHFTATDGVHVVFPTASTEGQEVVVVTFRALAASNVYTKPQTYSRAEVGTLLNDKQNSLGFDPVQQGGGVGQGTGKIRIGNDASSGSDKLLAQIGNKALGHFWLSSNFDPSKKVDVPAFKSLSEQTQLTAADMGEVRVTASVNTTIYLPASESVAGKDVSIRRMNGDDTPLIVSAVGSDRIFFHTHLSSSGYPFIRLMGQGDYWTLRSDGAGGWWPISRLDGSSVGRVTNESSIVVQPGGFGVTSGRLLNRADWPWLWDFARLSGMIVADNARAGNEGCWTTGNGTSTFRTPDVRAEFVRAWDEFRGIDTGRTPGSWQKGSLQTFDTSTGIPAVSGLWHTGADADIDVAHGLDKIVVADYPRSRAVSTTGTTTTEGRGLGISRPRNIALPARIKMI